MTPNSLASVSNLTSESSFGNVFKPILIIPCYNRREVTLNCLRQLGLTGVMETMEILVIDDGSTDGTTKAIEHEFPQVQIILGNGSLYWTGAIELGMREAYAQGGTVFVWLNDDSEIGPGSVEAIVTRCREIRGIVSARGQVYLPKQNYRENFLPLYRARNGLRQGQIEQMGVEMTADTCRGNLVAIHRDVVDRIGFPDGRHIPHYAGDTDYGLRATAVGIPLRIHGTAIVYEKCLYRDNNQSWLLSDQPLTFLWKGVFQKRNSLYPPMCFRYYWRHWRGHGLLHTSKLYLRLIAISFCRIIPRSIRIKLFAKYSSTWNSQAAVRALIKEATDKINTSSNPI